MARRAIWARRLSRLGLRPSSVQPRDARTFQEFELLDVAQDGLRRVGDGRAAEPGERGPSREASGTSRPSSKALAFAGQEGRQEAEGLVLGLLPGGDHEAFETGQARAHDLVGAELLAGELEAAGSAGRAPGPARRARP